MREFSVIIEKHEDGFLVASVPALRGCHTQAKSLDTLMKRIKDSLKNNFTFYTPLHPVWLRCESSEYPDIPAFSRLASRAPQRLKL
jgi:hypothetical protein